MALHWPSVAVAKIMVYTLPIGPVTHAAPRPTLPRSRAGGPRHIVPKITGVPGQRVKCVKNSKMVQSEPTTWKDEKMENQITMTPANMIERGVNAALASDKAKFEGVIALSLGFAANAQGWHGAKPAKNPKIWVDIAYSGLLAGGVTEGTAKRWRAMLVKAAKHMAKDCKNTLIACSTETDAETAVSLMVCALAEKGVENFGQLVEWYDPQPKVDALAEDETEAAPEAEGETEAAPEADTVDTPEKASAAILNLLAQFGAEMSVEDLTAIAANVEGRLKVMSEAKPKPKAKAKVKAAA